MSAKVHILFRFLLSLPSVLLLLQDPISPGTVIFSCHASLTMPLVCDRFFRLVFDDFDNFEKYWSRCMAGGPAVGVYLIVSP